MLTKCDKYIRSDTVANFKKNEKKPFESSHCLNPTDMKWIKSCKPKKKPCYMLDAIVERERTNENQQQQQQKEETYRHTRLPDNISGL